MKKFTFLIELNGEHEGTVQAHSAKDALDEWFGCEDFVTEQDETPQKATIVLHDGTYTATFTPEGVTA